MDDRNPPAFPRDHRHFGHNGLTMRDWFATHAPEPSPDRMGTERGIDRGRDPHNEVHKPPLRSDDQIRACLAYRYADAMLAQRMKDADNG